MKKVTGPRTPPGSPPPEKQPELSKKAIPCRMQTTSVSVPPGFEHDFASLHLSQASRESPSTREVLPQKERKVAGVAKGELPKTRILEESVSIESDFRVFHNDALIDVAEFLTHECGWLDQEKKQAVLAMVQAIDAGDLNPDNVLIIEESERLGEDPQSDVINKIFNVARFEDLDIKNAVDQLNKLEEIRLDLHYVKFVGLKQVFAKVWFYKVVLCFNSLILSGQPDCCPKKGIDKLMFMMLYGCQNDLQVLLPVDFFEKILKYLNAEKPVERPLKFCEIIIEKLEKYLQKRQQVESCYSKLSSKEHAQAQAESATALQEAPQGWDYESTKEKVITLLDDPDQEDLIDISSLPKMERFLDEKGNLFPYATYVLQYTWLTGKDITEHAHVMRSLQAIRRSFDQLAPDDRVLVQAFWCYRVFEYLGSFTGIAVEPVTVKRYIDETIDILRKEQKRYENVFASHYLGIKILEDAVGRLEFLKIMGHECEDTRLLLFCELETEKKLASIKLLVDEIVKGNADSKKVQGQSKKYKRDYRKPIMVSGVIADRHELLRNYEMTVISWCDMPDKISRCYILELVKGNLSDNKIPRIDAELLTKVWFVSLIELFDTVTDQSEIRKSYHLFERVYGLIEKAIDNGEHENLSFMYLDILEAALDVTSQWMPEARRLFQSVFNARMRLSEYPEAVMPPEPDSDAQTSDEEASGIAGSYDVTVTQTLDMSGFALSQSPQAGHATLSGKTVKKNETEKLNQTVHFVQKLLDGFISEKQMRNFTAGCEVTLALPIPISEGVLSDIELNVNFIYLLFCLYRDVPNLSRLEILNHVYHNVFSHGVQDSNKITLLLKLWMRRLLQIADKLKCADDYDVCFDLFFDLLKVSVVSHLHKILPYEKLGELQKVLEDIVNKKESEEAKSLLTSVEEIMHPFERSSRAGFKYPSGAFVHDAAAPITAEAGVLQEGSETRLPTMLKQFSDVGEVSVLPDTSRKNTGIEIDDIDSYVDNILEKREIDNKVQRKDLGHSCGKYISCFEQGKLSRNHASDMLNYLLRIDYEMCDDDTLRESFRPVQEAIPRITDEDCHMRCAKFFMHQMIENISRLADKDYLFEDETECLCVFVNGLEWCLKQGVQKWFSDQVVCDVLAQITTFSSSEEIECSRYMEAKIDEYLKPK